MLIPRVMLTIASSFFQKRDTGQHVADGFEKPAQIYRNPGRVDDV
jgi:hypothetical protein